jgi:hypothetical protein
MSVRAIDPEARTEPQHPKDLARALGLTRKYQRDPRATERACPLRRMQKARFCLRVLSMRWIDRPCRPGPDPQRLDEQGNMAGRENRHARPKC